jgi:NADH-quinone oxidoreductase subunit A
VSTYLAPLVVLATTIVAVLLVYAANRALAVQRRPLRVMPYLGGGEPAEHAVSRFHVRWYAVALMLLAFDMEMVFMYPWALVVGIMGAPAVIEMFTFLALLVAGVLYAWREGAFRWS